MNYDMTNNKTCIEETICPYMRKPFAVCYCVKDEKSNIDKVLYLCGGNFLNCKIYRNNEQAGICAEKEMKHDVTIFQH